MTAAAPVLQVVVFSRARPLQLYAYLSSLDARCTTGFEDDLSVSVLVRTDYIYEAAYAAVRASFPLVTWWEEKDFASDVLELLDPSVPYTLFGCDDGVFVGNWVLDTVAAHFEDDAEILGFSLRLGRNVVRDMFGNLMRQPQFIGEPDGGIVWDVQHPASEGDWAYPWEVLATVYRTSFARAIAEAVQPSSPNQLEARGARIWRDLAEGKHHLASFGTSRLVAPTVNVVQQEYPNGIVGRTPLSAEFLLQCWDAGLRLDHAALAGRLPPPSWRIGDFPLLFSS